MKEKVKMSESLIYIYLYLNVFCKAIDLYNSNLFYIILFFFGILMLVLKIFSDKYSLKEIVKCVVLVGLSALTFYVTRRPTLLIAMVTICSLKNVKIEKAFKGMLAIRIVCFISLILLALIGVIPNIKIMTIRGGASVLRYGLGHDHPNHLHLAFFLISVLFTFIKGKNINITEIGLFVIFNQIIYYFSASRSGYICTLLLFFLIVSYKYLKIYKYKITKYLGVIILSISIMFSFYTAMEYGNNQIINDLNVKFSNRIAYNNYYLNKYKPTMFGNSDVKEDMLASFDNSYIFVYTQYGIVGLMLILYFLYKIGLDKNLQKDFRINIMLVVFSIYLFEESFMPNIFLNIVLLFGGYELFKKKEVKLNE